MKKHVLSPNYQNETADQTSVAYVSRGGSDQIAMTFMRNTAFPKEESHELVTLQTGTVSMSVDAAKALHSTLGEILKTPKNASN